MFSDLEILKKKHETWTDAIKKDTKYVGIGTVSNQIKLGNGKIYEQQSLDRSFHLELKENEIFAYGIIDGYTDVYTADFLEQSLLTNLYFDHIQTISDKDDSDIYKLLDEEFQYAEQLLLDDAQKILMKRNESNLESANLRRNAVEYKENQNQIKHLEKQLSIGAFAVLSLIVDDRLFVSNVGTSHCFICVYDNNQKKVIQLDTEHSLKNWEELKRLEEFGADVKNMNFEDSNTIKHTRCLGDFRLKKLFYEYPQFQKCQVSPIVCEPQHSTTSFTIDDSFLFMALYSDGVVKAIEQTYGENCNPSAILALNIISKIINEQTLKSAAQSVLDEIKRAFDDKFSNELSEREDFTLLIRTFDNNIKNKLMNIEAKHHQTTNDKSFKELNLTTDELGESDEGDMDSVQNTMRTTNLDDTESSLEQTSSLLEDNMQLLDENGNVYPYLKFDEFEELIANDVNIEKFCSELESLCCKEKF